MDHQLQDTRAPPALVTGFSSADSLQHQVAGSVAVPQRHVAQHLQSEHSRTTPVQLLINMNNLPLRQFLTKLTYCYVFLHGHKLLSAFSHKLKPRNTSN